MTMPPRTKPIFSYPWLTGIAALGGLLLAGMPHLDILLFGLMPVLQALAPVLCILAVLVSTTLALLKRPAAAVILCVGALVGALPLLVPGSASREATSPPAAILSFNVERAGADTSALAAMISEHEVEVAVIVETDESFIRDLLSLGIEELLPFRSQQVSPGGVAGTVILSKYPVSQEEQIFVPPDIAALDQPVAVIEHPTIGRFRVAGVHPYPPIAGARTWRETLGAIETWQTENTDLPLVLAGDFNASHAHPGFRELASSFTDSAAASGLFPTPTWPATGLIPAFTAIDHVLVRDLTAVQWQRVKLSGTDHFGIIASIAKT